MTITQAQLISEIDTQLPTNNIRQITAADLRGVLTDMVGATFQTAVSPMNFGAFADGTEHPITQADIDANPQWAEIYAIGTSWDTVATQEAILAAFTNATPAPANGIHVEITSDTLTDCITGNPNILVNGFVGGGVKIEGSGNVAGLFFKFFFKQGPVLVTEVTMYQDTVNNQGTWQWQGSNDGTTWTNIGGTFTLGGANVQVQTTLNANTTSYSYYQLLGISGATVPDTTIFQEFEFKQNGAYVTSNRGTQYSWLSVVNTKLYVPEGTYWLNRTILLVAQFFDIQFAERGMATWAWHGAQNTIVFETDSICYGTVRNMRILCNAPVNIVWDMNGTGRYGGLKTQQLTIYDAIIDGQSSKYGIYISRNGGSAQGDTICFINLYCSNFKLAGAVVGGQNALSIMFAEGDFQANWKDSIAVFGGNAFVWGTSFQGQAAPLYLSPPRNQIALGGADIHVYGGAGNSVINTARDIRSESDVLVVSAGIMVVDACGTSAAGMNNWFASYPYLKGHLLKPSSANNNTKGRTFVPVDLSGTGAVYPTNFRPLDAASSTTTKVVDPAAAYVVNQWVGFRLHLRFSNGFTEHHVVSSNTATEVFLVGDPLSEAPNPLCLYSIGGITGAAAPNFDGLADGFFYPSGQASQGFTTVANSNQLLTSGAITGSIGIGSYVYIPDADIFGYEGTTTALIAKIIADLGPSGAQEVWQMDRVAGLSVTFSQGYWGSALVDNQVSYINLNYAAVSGCLRISNTSLAAGNNFSSGNLSGVNFANSSFQSVGFQPTPDPDRMDIIANKQFRLLDFSSVGSTGVIDLTTALNTSDIFTFTPTNDVTLNAPALPYVTLSRRISFHIVTSGAVSFNVTFGTNFKSTGVLATGVTTDKAFVVVFESCKQGVSSFWHEVSRSGPM